MGIHIQTIETHWTKNSRGNPGASKRNSVPELLPVRTDASCHGIILQEILFHEYHDDFTTASYGRVRKINENQVRQAGLDFSFKNDSLEIAFWNEQGFKKRAGTLSIGTWGQIKTNWRTLDFEGEWWYYKRVYNIFFGDLEKVEHTLLTQNCRLEKDFQSLLI